MMTSADLVRADHEAMLIVGSFVAAQQDPAAFERFTERMLNEWARRDAANAANRSAAAEQAVIALGRIQAARGTQPGVDAAPVDNHAAPAKESVGGQGTSV